MQETPSTLILGIGNTLLADEGLGLHLLDYLRRRHPELPGVTWLDGGTLSFTLAPMIEDCHNLIVLDAAQLQLSPGAICLFEGEEMDAFLSQGRRSVHEVGLGDLMSIARIQGRLPARRALLGIQPLQFGWGESPSDAVARSIPDAAARVVGLLYKWQVINNTSG
ncbi:MAG: HyaD/HybD family hydrogenase maturation endopeptidase [Thiogranum sp.]|jgi:hydrogenase maturation protease